MRASVVFDPIELPLRAIQIEPPIIAIVVDTTSTIWQRFTPSVLNSVIINNSVKHDEIAVLLKQIASALIRVLDLNVASARMSRFSYLDCWVHGSGHAQSVSDLSDSMKMNKTVWYG